MGIKRMCRRAGGDTETRGKIVNSARYYEIDQLHYQMINCHLPLFLYTTYILDIALADTSVSLDKIQNSLDLSKVTRTENILSKLIKYVYDNFADHFYN